MKKDSEKLGSFLNLHRIVLDKNVEKAVKNCIKDKILPKNVATYYRIFEVFKLSNLSKLATTYIQSWFTTVTETKNFLELDFVSLKKILSSSELLITSEIQVFNAVVIWINHDFYKRKKHAKDLIMTVRTNLLPENALEYALNEKEDEIAEKCESLIYEVIKHNETSLRSKRRSGSDGTRCFNKNNFDILTCGNCLSVFDIEPKRNIFNKIDGDNMLRSRSLQSLPKNSFFNIRRSSVINLKGDVYLFNCFNSANSDTNLIEKYSIVNDSYETVGIMDFDLSHHCACGFIDEIYFFGGYLQGKPTATCVYFDTNDYTWVFVASMKETRLRAACAVFEERVVVSGGYNTTGGTLKTVEAYDPNFSEWSYMPSMIEEKYNHRLVAVKNKLFAVGKDLVEVYDSSCKFFVSVTQPNWYDLIGLKDIINVIYIENKLIVFFYEHSKYLVYHVDKDKWTVSSCCMTYRFSTKIPKLTL